MVEFAFGVGFLGVSLGDLEVVSVACVQEYGSFGWFSPGVSLGEAEGLGVEFYGCVQVSDSHGEVVESASFDLLVCSGHVLLLVWFVVLGCGGGIRGLGVAGARGIDYKQHSEQSIILMSLRPDVPYSFLHFTFRAHTRTNRFSFS